MTERGAVSPVQISNWRTACSMNMSRPGTTVLPCSLARLTSTVSSGLYTMSKTMSAGILSSKKHSFTCGNMPSGVACTTASKWWESSCSLRSGSAPQILLRARTRSALRPTREILAPASDSAQAALRAAPPLPTISTDAFAILSRRESGPVTPAASVLVPRHLPALRQTVLTAPMRRASGSTTSR